MELGLKGKTALITGSSRGMGKALAAAFLAEGARVIVTGRDSTTLQKAARELGDTYGAGNVAAYQGDMTKADVIGSCIQEGLARFGGIDVLVAGVGSGQGQPGLEADAAEWQRMMELNLLGSVEAARQVVPVMKKGGSIIFIASIAGLESTAAPLPYATAKAGLLAFAKQLSRELAADNIRVNAVAPGNVLAAGNRWEERFKADPDTVNDYLRQRVPMQRFGRPEEIAAAVVFLASEQASFITGACLVADGGETTAFK